jgi:hypothetical protein
MNTIGSLAAISAAAVVLPAGARAVGRGVEQAVHAVERDINATVHAVGSVVTGTTNALVSGVEAIGRGGKAVGRVVDIFV